MLSLLLWSDQVLRLVLVGGYREGSSGLFFPTGPFRRRN
jgi:hypothetical protein